MNSKADFEGERPLEAFPSDQRALIELARRWGWPEHLIKVIDADLGPSGSSSKTAR